MSNQIYDTVMSRVKLNHNINVQNSTYSRRDLNHHKTAMQTYLGINLVHPPPPLTQPATWKLTNQPTKCWFRLARKYPPSSLVCQENWWLLVCSRCQPTDNYANAVDATHYVDVLPIMSSSVLIEHKQRAGIILLLILTVESFAYSL